MKTKVLISFSGGETSAYMTYTLLNNWADKFEMIVVFANTGKERPETLEFIHKLETEWHFPVVWVEALVDPEYGKGIRHTIVTYETASRNGEPFEAIIAKYGIPNQEAPFCSDYMKRLPILSYAKSIGWEKYKTAIGIRKDEPSRINWEKVRKRNLLYPFVTLEPTTKQDVIKFWSRQGWRLNLKSYEGNCDMCWKKSLRKLLTITKDNPQLTEWWDEMFQQYGYHLSPKRKENPNIKLPLNFFRENITITEMKEESNFKFVKAIDESKYIVTTHEQLALWDQTLDKSDGCTESCEVF